MSKTTYFVIMKSPKKKNGEVQKTTKGSYYQ